MRSKKLNTQACSRDGFSRDKQKTPHREGERIFSNKQRKRARCQEEEEKDIFPKKQRGPSKFLPKKSISGRRSGRRRATSPEKQICKERSDFSKSSLPKPISTVRPGFSKHVSLDQAFDFCKPTVSTDRLHKNQGFDLSPFNGQVAIWNVDAEQWSKYLVLRELLVSSRLPVRLELRLRSLSKLFYNAPLQLCRNISASPAEHWLIMQKISLVSGFKNFTTICPWKFVAFSDAERKFFKIPSLCPAKAGDVYHRAADQKLRALLCDGDHQCTSVKDEDNLFNLNTTLHIVKAYYPSLSSSGGLMCASVVYQKEKSDRVIVFNCISGSVKILPRFLCDDPLWKIKRDCYEISMSTAVNGWDYYILLTKSRYSQHIGKYFSYDWSRAHFQVYDSSRNCWIVPQSIHSAMSSDSSRLLHCDFHMLRVHHCDEDDSFPIVDSINVMGYKVSDNCWITTTLVTDGVQLFPSQDICRENLIDSTSAFMKYNGRLFMLFCSFMRGAIYEMYDPKVLELVPISSGLCSIKEISTMPKHLVLKGEVEPRLAAGGNLFSVTFAPRFKCSYAYNDKHLIVYDIAKDVWYPVPVPRDEAAYVCFSIVNPQLSMAFPNVH